MQPLLVNPQEIRGIVTMAEAVDAVRLGFREWGENPQLNAPRRRIHIPSGVRVSVHQGGVPAAKATGLMTHCEWVKPMADEQVYPRLNHPVIVLYDSAEGELKGIIIGEITCAELPNNVAVTGLRAFKPTDEIEGMIAAQAMAAHHASMECSRRAMIPDQAFEAAQGLRKAAANASRTFIELLSALDRKRGKGGQQIVRVEHVHVHQGGQALVGNVQTGDGAAVRKPAPPLAIGQEQAGITLDDLIGKQPELVGREGV